MMNWVVRYYDGELPLISISSDDMEWYELPQTGVVDVFIEHGGYSHLLSGVDNYWLSGNFYGWYNNTGSLGEWEEEQRRVNGHEQVVYEGSMMMVFEWEDPEQHLVIGEYIPENVHVISGVMLPDELARELGMI
jgi:hypothetical protein